MNDVSQIYAKWNGWVEMELPDLSVAAELSVSGKDTMKVLIRGHRRILRGNNARVGFGLQP